MGGSALLFGPGAGPLVVRGPLAAVGAAHGALLGGGVGAVLGHLVAKEHIPKHERLVSAGKHLAVAHGTEDNVARARNILTDAGSTDVQRHDTFRSGRLGPIRFVQEGMRVVDASGRQIGKVELVKLGDPDAVTARARRRCVASRASPANRANCSCDWASSRSTVRASSARTPMWRRTRSTGWRATPSISPSPTRIC